MLKTGPSWPTLRLSRRRRQSQPGSVPKKQVRVTVTALVVLTVGVWVYWSGTPTVSSSARAFALVVVEIRNGRHIRYSTGGSVQAPVERAPAGCKRRCFLVPHSRGLLPSTAGCYCARYRSPCHPKGASSAQRKGRAIGWVNG